MESSAIYEFIAHKGIDLSEEWKKKKISSKKIRKEIKNNFFERDSLHSLIKLSYLYALEYRIKNRYNSFLKRFFRYLPWKNETKLLFDMKKTLNNEDYIVKQMSFLNENSSNSNVNSNGGAGSSNYEKNSNENKDKNFDKIKVPFEINDDAIVDMNGNEISLEEIGLEDFEIEDVDEFELKSEEPTENLENDLMGAEKSKDGIENVQTEPLKNERKIINIVVDKDYKIVLENALEKGLKNDYRVPIDIDKTKENKSKQVIEKKQLENTGVLAEDIVQIMDLIYNDGVVQKENEKIVNYYTDYAMESNEPINAENDDQQAERNENAGHHNQRDDLTFENRERLRINDEIINMGEENLSIIRDAMQEQLNNQIRQAENNHFLNREAIDVEVDNHDVAERGQVNNNDNNRRPNANFRINR